MSKVKKVTCPGETCGHKVEPIIVEQWAVTFHNDEIHNYDYQISEGYQCPKCGCEFDDADLKKAKKSKVEVSTSDGIIVEMKD